MTAYISRDESNAELAHYGVKGMKWNKHLKANIRNTMEREGFRDTGGEQYIGPSKYSSPNQWQGGKSYHIYSNGSGTRRLVRDSTNLVNEGLFNINKKLNKARDTSMYMPGKGATSSKKKSMTRGRGFISRLFGW